MLCVGVKAEDSTFVSLIIHCFPLTGDVTKLGEEPAGDEHEHTCLRPPSCTSTVRNPIAYISKHTVQAHHRQIQYIRLDKSPHDESRLEMLSILKKSKKSCSLSEVSSWLLFDLQSIWKTSCESSVSLWNTRHAYLTTTARSFSRFIFETFHSSRKKNENQHFLQHFFVTLQPHSQTHLLLQPWDNAFWMHCIASKQGSPILSLSYGTSHCCSLCATVLPLDYGNNGFTDRWPCPPL